jgi:hypothetical protein
LEFEQIGALLVAEPKQVGTTLVVLLPVAEHTGAVLVLEQIGVLLTNGSFVKSIPTLNVAGWPGVTELQVAGTVIHESLADARMHSFCVMPAEELDVAVVEKTDKVTGLGFDSCSFAM